MSWLDDLFAQQNGGGILNGMYPSPLPGDAPPRAQTGSVFETGAAPFGFAGLAAKTPPQAAFPQAGGNGASEWTQPSFAEPDATAPAVAMAMGHAAGMNGNDEIGRAAALRDRPVPFNPAPQTPASPPYYGIPLLPIPIGASGPDTGMRNPDRKYSLLGSDRAAIVAEMNKTGTPPFAPDATVPAFVMAPEPTPSYFRTFVPRNYAPLSLAGPAPQQAMPSEDATPNNVVRCVATGVPLIGAVLNRMNAATNATLAPALNRLFNPEDQLPEQSWSGRYAHSLRDQQGVDAGFSKEHPYVNAAGNLAGSMALFGLLGKTAMGARMLGQTEGPLAGKMLQSTITHAAVGGADAAARGKDVVQGGLRGAVVGPLGPLVSRGKEVAKEMLGMALR